MVLRQLPTLASDEQVARAARPRPIADVARDAGLAPDEFESYGGSKAKVTWEALAKHRADARGRLILVTAMTATAAGEGKTVTSIGLGEGLQRIGVRHIVCLRQPSLGPVFGIKGGATGGGIAQLHPREDINLHFTGDFHAITSAHNLLAACVDNSVYFGNPLGIERILWRRAMDLCDRQLREIEVGLGGKANGFAHKSGFDITAASEVMAVLALANDRDDMERRLESIVVGERVDGSLVRAKELGCVGAMMVLLRDAMRPNLAQTLEGSPVFVHAGPFANIAHGCSSVAGTRLALSLADVVVTEAGFASDLGAEKFFHIKCRQVGFAPSLAVLVVSCRAARAHGLAEGGNFREPDIAAMRRGLANVRAHVEILRRFGVPVLLAANRFRDDPADELHAFEDLAKEMSIGFALSEVASLGGEGGEALARAAMGMLGSAPPPLKSLYPLSAPLRAKIETIARDVYGADGVDYDEGAARDLDRLEAQGFGTLPVCMAKTQASLSDNPKLPGAPRGWRLRVREASVRGGAGFVVVQCGKIVLMPGMPEKSRVGNFALGPSGEIEGLG